MRQLCSIVREKWEKRKGGSKRVRGGDGKSWGKGTGDGKPERIPHTQNNGQEKGGKTLIAHHTSFKEQFAMESKYPARI